MNRKVYRKIILTTELQLNTKTKALKSLQKKQTPALKANTYTMTTLYF